MKRINTILLVSILALSVVSTASAVKIDSIGDVDVEGMIVGVQSGTTSDIYAQDNFDNAKINGYDSILLAEEALEAGDVHVIMGDKPVLDAYAADKPEWGVLAKFSEELFGLGVKEGEDDLLDALNAALDEIFNDNTANGYDAIYAEWFDDTPAVYDDGDGSYAYPAIGDLDANGRLKAALDRGDIEFGTDPTYPPFEEKLTDGTYEGFDVDMMHEITKRIGDHYGVSNLNVTIVDSDWDPIIPNLKAGEFDVVLSAMTKTAERDAEIDFTRAYYGSIQAVLGPADGEVDVDTPLPFLPVLIGFATIGLLVRRRRS